MPRRRGVEAQHPMQAKALASQVCRSLPTMCTPSSRHAQWGPLLTAVWSVLLNTGGVDPHRQIVCEGE